MLNRAGLLPCFSVDRVLAAGLISVLGAGCGADDVSTDESAGSVADESANTGNPNQPSTTVELARFEGHYDAQTNTFEFRQVPRELPPAYADGVLRSASQASVAAGSWCTANVVSDTIQDSNPPETFEIYSDNSTLSFAPAACTSLVSNALGARRIPARLRADATDFFAGAFCFDTVVTNFYTADTFSHVIAEVQVFDGATTEQPYRYPLGTTAPSVQDATVDETIATWHYGASLSPGQSARVPWVFKFGGNDFSFAGRLIAQVYEDCSNGDDDDCDGAIDSADVDCHQVPTYTCTTNADCATNNCVSGLCQNDCRPGFWGPSCTWPCASATCSGHGTCNDGLPGDGTCTCDSGFSGEACETSGACAEGYWGATCTACPGGGGASQCSGHGTCNDGNAGNGLCVCSTGWAGASCNDCAANHGGAACLACPGGVSNCCNGNGTFNGGIAGGFCSCSGGYTGPDCSVPPAAFSAPTGVAATDGSRTDGVGITWNPVSGAISYDVLRDLTPIATGITTTSFVDTTAAMGAIFGGAVTASDATSPYQVALQVTGATAVPSLPSSYTVVAFNGSTYSSLATADDGYRGVGAVSAQWQRTGVDSGASHYVNIEGGIGPNYDDILAPADGAGRYYRAQLIAPGALPTPTASDRGSRAPAPPPLGALVVGDYHTCRLTSGGGAECWGSNSDGQLGSGSTGTERLTPAAVTGLSGVVSLSAGAAHTCALLSDGTVKCWGLGTTGQIGNGAFSSQATATAVAGVSGAISISTGSNHTCAVLSSGGVRCWGNNSGGQLGDGTITHRSSSIAVSGITTAIAVAAGNTHSCAVLSTGAVQCWGTNSAGNIGDGTTTTRTTPVSVSGLSSAVAVVAGNLFSCALLSSGSVRCWGTNSGGQLGDGTTTQRTTPVAVTGITDARHIAAGSAAVCIIRQNGEARCWGQNSSYQVGDGTNVSRSTSVRVHGLGSALSLDAGLNSACATLTSGEFRCWGLAASARGGSAADRWLPGVSTSAPNATRIGSGGYHSCAVPSDGSLHCWGNNSLSQLGDGTTTSRVWSGPVTGLTNVVDFDAQDFHGCAVLSDGTVRCWGDNTYGQIGDGTGTARTTPVAVSGISTATDVSVGLTHTCARLVDGTVRCWGYNASGQLGDGTTATRSTPVVVTGISTATAVEAGNGSTCALLASGTVSCWGANNFGQLGDATLTNRSNPVAVSGLSGVASIAGGYDHTCAVLTSGAMRCWGRNASGRLGDGTSTNQTAPVAVVNVTTAVEAAAGTGFTCARLADGSAACWGANSSGQLGIGTATSWPTAQPVVGLSNVASIVAGNSHACARLTTGAVECWGDNLNGQLGRVAGVNQALPGTTGLGAGFDPSTNRSAMSISAAGLTMISSGGALQYVREGGPALTGVAGVASAATHSCAVMTSGTVRCWGANTGGQLGDGTTVSSTTPVTVSGITTATAVVVSENRSSCALLADGTVRCWGNNSNSQLGDGTTTQRTTPVAVSGISTATGIAIGLAHGCAVLADGTVRCWGYNWAGQAGDASLLDQPTPVAVPGLSGATAIVAVRESSCALLSTGGVRCWGANGSSELGNGGGAATSTPQVVSGVTTATAIAAGYRHICALLSGGGVRCWGDNAEAQIGDGTAMQLPFPRNVRNATNSGDLTGVSHIYASQTVSCARLTTGGLRCWGGDSAGDLSGLPFYFRYINFVSPSVGVRYHQVVTNGSTTCALTSLGTVRCWGQGGRLGRNDVSTIGDDEPATATNLRDVVLGGVAVELAAVGTGVTCALLSNGNRRCWGDDGSLIVGDDEVVSSVPNAFFPQPPVGRAFVALAGSAYSNLGSDGVCAIVDDGSLQCGSSTITLPGGRTAVAVAVGRTHTCAVLDDLTVRCWGASNVDGVLGSGSTGGVASPDLGAALTPRYGVQALDIEAGAYTTLMYGSDGNAYAWGSNQFGGLGAGTPTLIVGDDEPIVNNAVTLGPPGRGFSGRASHLCAGTSGGSGQTLRCWGANASGQLGTGNTTTLGDDESVWLSGAGPQVALGASVISATTAQGAVCALGGDWQIRCWGDNGTGELGQGHLNSIGDDELGSSGSSLAAY